MNDSAIFVDRFNESTRAFDRERLSNESRETFLSLDSNLRESFTMIHETCIVIEMITYEVLVAPNYVDFQHRIFVDVSIVRDEFIHDARVAFECEQFTSFVFDNDDRARAFIAHIASSIDFSV